ncbi:hypothetical protein GQ53DRAFT_808840 [Thozetella sp. PMI_491]|nr:hypothetical protein GQ53DRAFT_808840 [Thozetella sp. PMI_491]
MAQEPAWNNSGQGPLEVPGFNGVSLDKSLDRHGYYTPESVARQPFAHGCDSWSADRLTVREISMLRLMDTITDKAEWTRKIFDDGIVARWKAESMALPDDMISEQAWDWVLTELRDRAPDFDAKKRVLTYDTGSRVAKADALVDPALRDELKRSVAGLLAVPEAEKDWHPGSDGKVLNLVHPSLFPLVYGRTEVLSQGGSVDLENIFASCGTGEVAPTQPVPEQPAQPRRHFFGQQRSNAELYWSRRFQWLPSEVEFCAEEGTGVKLTSYINNLHPEKHQDLYRTIEKFISLSIPLWNEVLVRVDRGRTPPRIKTLGPEWDPPSPDWQDQLNKLQSRQDPRFPELLEKTMAFLTLDEPAYDLDEDEEEMYEEEDLEVMRASAVYSGDPAQHPRVVQMQQRLDEAERSRVLTAESSFNSFGYSLLNAVYDKWKVIRQTTHPNPGVSFTYEEWKAGVQRPIVQNNSSRSQSRSEARFKFTEIHLEDTFRSKGLQIIPKLASIELTPEKPKYEGGSWHLEGMLNEHIVATAIYYFDVENVTDASLSFRQKAYLDEMELVYEQGEHDPLSIIFGTERMTDEPAVQVLGNVKTPGGRLLAFPNTLQHRVSPFKLVDPSKPGHRRFLVLWLVDPQYRICSTRNVPPQRHDWWAEKGYSKLNLGLPREVMNMISGQVGEYPMGIEEAQNLRLELMKERTQMTERVQEDFEQYNLCEH